MLLVLLLLLHSSVRISHTSMGVSLVAHSVGLSTISTVLLRVVLVLVLLLLLVVVMSIASAVSTATALVLVTTGCGVVRVTLMALVIVMRRTVALVLSHNLRVSESTLNGTSELLCVSRVSVIVSNSLLLVSTHSIELMLGGSSVLSSVVQGRVGVGNGAWHAGRNTGSRRCSRDGGIVRRRRIHSARIGGGGHTRRWSLGAVESMLGKRSLWTVLAVTSDSGTVGLSGLLLLLRHTSENRLHESTSSSGGVVVIVHTGHNLLLLVL